MLEKDEAQSESTYEMFGRLFHYYSTNYELQEIISKRAKFILNRNMGMAFILTPKYSNNGFFFEDDKIELMQYVGTFMSKRSPSLASEATTQMTKFLHEMTRLDDAHSQIIKNMSGNQYWEIFGKQLFPALYEVAKVVTKLITSSASSERNWSIYRFIHSRLRNRLTNEKVEKLVFLYTNCMIADKYNEVVQLFGDQLSLDSIDFELE